MMKLIARICFLWSPHSLKRFILAKNCQRHYPWIQSLRVFALLLCISKKVSILASRWINSILKNMFGMASTSLQFSRMLSWWNSMANKVLQTLAKNLTQFNFNTLNYCSWVTSASNRLSKTRPSLCNRWRFSEVCKQSQIPKEFPWILEIVPAF